MLAGYTLSGVWRWVRRHGLVRRRGRAQLFSPDPAYTTKREHLLACLREAAAAPDRVVVVFLDEMGYARWPEPGPAWGPPAPAPAPVADRHGAANRLWRLVGALDARTGRVMFADGYVVGRRALRAFYRQLDAAYPEAARIYVVQDNWSIHRHPEVQAIVATLPRIEPIWLPTYSPWLNPIEKLWRYLRQTVLRQHPLAGDGMAVRDRVRAVLAQFADGSEDLLTYVGLRGDGALAQALRPPPATDLGRQT